MSRGFPLSWLDGFLSAVIGIFVLWSLYASADTGPFDLRFEARTTPLDEYCFEVNCRQTDEKRDCHICSTEGITRASEAGWSACDTTDCFGVQYKIACDKFCVKGELRKAQ